MIGFQVVIIESTMIIAICQKQKWCSKVISKFWQTCAQSLDYVSYQLLDDGIESCGVAAFCISQLFVLLASWLFILIFRPWNFLLDFYPVKSFIFCHFFPPRIFLFSFLLSFFLLVSCATWVAFLVLEFHLKKVKNVKKYPWLGFPTGIHILSYYLRFALHSYFSLPLLKPVRC